MINPFRRAPESFGWFWLFPARQTSIDPEGGVRRRHHLHGQVCSDAIKRGGELTWSRETLEDRIVLPPYFGCELAWRREILEPKRHLPLLVTQSSLPATGVLEILLAKLGEQPRFKRSTSLMVLEKHLAELDPLTLVLILDDAQKTTRQPPWRKSACS